MGFKAFVRSRNGRAGIFVTALALLGLGIAGGILWWAFYLPSISSTDVDAKVLESSASKKFVSASVVEEETPLAGLPSKTLSIEDNFNSESPNETLRYPSELLKNTELDSLVNVHLYREAQTGDKGLSYDFKFYSSSLNDYKEGDSYDQAVEQYMRITGEGVSKASYSSKPLPTGGRELEIALVSSTAFESSGVDRMANAWAQTVTGLGSTINFDSGAKVSLKLTDSTGKVTVGAVLSSQKDVDAAVNLNPGIWPTFSTYLFSTSFKFLKVQSLTYQVERTSEDSVLTLTVDEELRGVGDLENQLYSTLRKSDDQILLPGSYITYFVTPDNGSPLLTLYSSSRNW